jgi:signal transduction histidine kinase/serine phosphatase RsbU (regulator of sigma subunit)/CheY-like chemotaxis protein
LGSRFPVIIFWGPDLVQIYNDAYVPVLGAKHPEALGQPAAKCFPEIWDLVGPMLHGVLATGQATWDDDLLLMLERGGFPEECYFTFSYSPVGAAPAEGIFCAVIETTRRVVGERRLDVLRDLSSSLAGARRTDEALEMAVTVMARHPSDLPAGVLHDLRASGTDRVWSSEGDPRLLEALALEARRAGAEAGETLSYKGKSAVEHDQKDVLERPWCATSSIAKFGSALPAAKLALQLNPHVRYDDSYRSFLELVANTIGQGLSSAEAHEEAGQRARALEELDRAKTTFLANISHEFRTPLSLILSPIDDYVADQRLPDDVRIGLAMAARNGRRLLKLVNSLLDVARLEAGRATPTFEPTDLASFTADLVSVFRSAADLAGVQLDVECEPLGQLVSVDREMWEQIVTNLCANALKFTTSGSVNVRLSSEGGSVRLVVDDTGIGISADELPFIFDQFRRAASPGARTYEGTGLGLAIVRELVSLHEGTVEVTSTAGRGSTFTVTIPRHRRSADDGISTHTSWNGRALSTTAAEVVQSVETLVSQSRNPHRAVTAPTEDRDRDQLASDVSIYVVDDNADMRSYISGLLCRYWSVMTFGDPLDALEAARTLPPDMVLADVMMPALDGLSLVAELRSRPATASVPILLLSARAGEEATLEGLDAGADDYLVKPFTSRALLARIRSHLDLAKLRKDLTERTTHHLNQLADLATAAGEIGNVESVDEIVAIAENTAAHMTGAGRSVRDCQDHLTVEPSSTLQGHADRTRLFMALSDSTGPPIATIELTAKPGTTFDDDQQALVNELGRVASLRIASVLRFQREHHVSHTLQRGLLPRSLPDVKGFELAARYRSATGSVEVGGDWYDAVVLPDGRLMISVGDVIGHDLDAAVTMGEIRHFLRACGPGSADPGELCLSVNGLLQGGESMQVATAVVAFIDPSSGATTVVNAGHPPCLVISPEGVANRLEIPASPPLGAFGEAKYGTTEFTLALGSTLLLYSDGLVERRDENIDDSIDKLVARSSGASDRGIDDILDLLLNDALAPLPNNDDIVILALRRGSDGGPL